MRFELLFLGKTKEEYLARGIADFSARLKRYVDLSIRTLKNGHDSGRDDEAVRRAEGRLLLARLAPGSRLVALDPGGRAMTSPGLAELLTGWENEGAGLITFVLGGPLGLAPEVLARADLTISLSLLTFTHEMARLILLEQLYRAWTIKANTGYHK